MLLLLLACETPTESLTWHADVAPAIDGACARCHAPGSPGPGDFTSYEDAKSWAPFMVEAIESGEMPPPLADPDCRPWQGWEDLVPDPELASTLQAWIDAGSPEGDPATAPVVERPEIGLASPDLTVQINAAYTPTFTDEHDPGNEYRCFVVEHGQTEPFYIRRMAPIVDQGDIVHHMLLFAATEDEIPANDPETGWSCINDPFVGGDSAASVLAGNGILAGWAPGMLPIEFEDGVGIRVTPDQKLVIQVHYFDIGPGSEGLQDRPGWAFELYDEPVTPLMMAPMGVYGFRIPADDPAVTLEQGFELPIDMRLYGVFPHMHKLGISYHMELSDEDGTECLVTGGYDFENQMTYMFEDSKKIKAGQTISMSCTWDNSADNPNQLFDPPQEIRYGERTDEEMCFGFSYIGLGG